MTTWDTLANQLQALDAALAQELSAIVGRRVIVGEDWAPPGNDTNEKLDYLERAHDSIASALKKAEDLDEKARAKTRETAKAALSTAKKAATVVAKTWVATHVSPVPMAEDVAKTTARTETVKKSLDTLWDGAKFGATVFGLTQGTAIVIALVAAWLYFSHQKRET